MYIRAFVCLYVCLNTRKFYRMQLQMVMSHPRSMEIELGTSGKTTSALICCIISSAQNFMLQKLENIEVYKFLEAYGLTK